MQSLICIKCFMVGAKFINDMLTPDPRWWKWKDILRGIKKSLHVEIYSDYVELGNISLRARVIWDRQNIRSMWFFIRHW